MEITKVKNAKLCDINVMDVTVKELVEFLNELQIKMPHAYQIIICDCIRKLHKEMKYNKAVEEIKKRGI